jgi:putative hemolysin
MIEGVFRLGDRRVVELMQPSRKVAYLDAGDSWAVNREILKGSPYSRFPVTEGALDNVIGILHVKDLVLALDDQRSPDLRQLARRALIVPETTPALDVLEKFQESGEQMGLVVDEHGSVEGIVTVTDLLEAVVGELRGPGELPQVQITRRDDGSWLADGSLPIPDLIEELELRKVPGEEEDFATLAGLILAHLRRIPVPGDHVVVDGWRFEVVDIDGNRIDKVLICRPRRTEVS